MDTKSSITGNFYIKMVRTRQSNDCKETLRIINKEGEELPYNGGNRGSDLFFLSFHFKTISFSGLAFGNLFQPACSNFLFFIYNVDYVLWINTYTRSILEGGL